MLLVVEPASLIQQVPLVQLGHQVNRAGGPKAQSFHCCLLSSDLSMRLVVKAWPAVCAGDAPREREPDEPMTTANNSIATLLRGNYLGVE